jgi:hypothetical protein
MSNIPTPAIKYRSGLSSAGAYQVSAIPYLSGSSATIPGTNSASWQVSFPYITKWITIENKGSNALRIGFSDNGVRGITNDTPKENYFVLAAPGDNGLSRITLDLRVKDIFLATDHATQTTTAQIVAGVTMIPTEELTGAQSNWSGSSGVG